MTYSPLAPAEGELSPTPMVQNATAEAGSPLLMAAVGSVRRHISAEELSIHISAIAAKADQARACGDRHGSRLYAAQMISAVKDHYKAAAREQRWLDELTFGGDWAQAHEGWAPHA